MQRIMLKSKIHRATVTCSNVDYEGSIAIDEELMELSGLMPFEQVQVYNINNGNRFETYTIKGERGSGQISVNGAAAHLAKEGDLIIIASYASYEEVSSIDHKPVLVYVDERNAVTKISAECAGAE